MLSGPVCDCACPPQTSREDLVSTPYTVFSTPSLRAKERLPLAAFAPRLSSLVFRLLPFQKVPIERTVVPHPQSPALDREEEGGQRPQPTAAIIDSQSVKTTEESAHPSGYDTHKNVKGRKRRLLVDSLGLLLSVYVSPADVQDRGGALSLLAGLKALLPRLKKIWADGPTRERRWPGGAKSRGSGNWRSSSGVVARIPKASLSHPVGGSWSGRLNG